MVNNSIENKFSNNLIPLKDTRLIYIPSYFSIVEADVLFSEFQKSIEFDSGTINIFGKEYQKPRLEAFYAEQELSYSYSGKKLQTRGFTTVLRSIKQHIENEFQLSFNALLMNLYRDGRDSNGWHSDNEKELGTNPIIASLSFGAERRFEMKHNLSNERFKINLEHGSLFIMLEGSQIYWKHQIPKDTKINESRINLTFRKIL